MFLLKRSAFVPRYFAERFDSIRYQLSDIQLDIPTIATSRVEPWRQQNLSSFVAGIPASPRV
jgi:hypothetical protein